MAKFASEKELADELRMLTEKVRKLQDEIRGDAWRSRRDADPALPIDDDRRLRPLTDIEPKPPPGGSGSND